MTDNIKDMFIKVAQREVQEEYSEYLEEMADLREQGYGRSHCFHGTNLWVDYDNICWQCEDSVTPEEIAIARGEKRYAEIMKMDAAAKQVKEAFGKQYSDTLFTEMFRLMVKYGV